MIDKNHLLAVIRLHGINNPILGKDLALKFDCTQREIREVIMNFRRQVPAQTIASGKDGYFYAADYQELEPTLHKMKTNAIAELTTRANLAKAFSIDLQIDLFL